MSFFTNKKFLFKLIATLCLFLTIFNFAIPPKANATEATLSKVGGTLLDPFIDLLCALGDGTMEIIQQAIMGTDATAIFDNTKESWWVKVGKAILTVIIVVAAVALLASLGLLGAVAVAAAKVIVGGLIINALSGGAVTAIISGVGATVFSDSVVFPMFTIGPEEIFSGRVLLFDANIFDPEEVRVRFSDSSEMTLEEWNEAQKNSTTSFTAEDVEKYYYIDEDRDVDEDGQPDEIATSMNNSAYQLKDIISKWYYVIRNIAIIGLMLVLMYVGIRMLLSSIASEKAKYKQMLFDWLVAMCLVFVLHYFMVFANHFVDNIVSIFASTTETKMHVVAIKDATQKLKDAVSEINPDYVTDDGTILWPTNMMGKIRLEAQQYTGESTYIGYGLCYVVLVFYTVFFTFTYLKRLLYLLFLTIIAPLVAFSYPLDKIRDGNAQAFEMWMKEYIVNLLIQPFHLLLYIIFITMAFDLAGTNIIYSLVVIGFMIPAEKFLRKMFGLDKASSPGFLAGAAGAAMTISAVQSLAKFASGGKGGSNKQSNANNNKIQQVSNDNLGDSTPPEYSMDSLLDQTAGTQTDQQQGDDGDNQPPNDSQQEDNGQQRELDEQSQNELQDDEANQVDNPETQDYEPENDQDDFSTRLEELDAEEEQGNFLTRAINSTPQFKDPKGYIKARYQNFKRDNFNKEKVKNTLKGGAKRTISGVAKYGLGATGAMLGLAAGIASGSPGDALKYGIAGAYAGSSIGTGVTNRMESGISNMIEKGKQNHEDALRTQLGDKEYKLYKQKEMEKEFMENAENRKKYADKFGLKEKKDIDEIMKQAVKYKRYGVSDDKVIMSAMKLNENDRANVNSIAAARFAQITKNEKDLESNMKRYGKTKGITKTQVEQMEKNIRTINDM